jgi:hypothetical protein
MPEATDRKATRPGTVGEDDATYPHLHFEIRKGSAREEDSVHPLGYLHYEDTSNFSAPARPL